MKEWCFFPSWSQILQFLFDFYQFLLQDLQGVDAAPRTARIRGVTTADPLQASTPENQSLNQTFRYI